MSSAIEFDHVGKQYRLGLVSTKTLSHDLNRWWQTAILKKDDPYLKIGETNDRATAGNSEYVWALRDIDFKVEQGDVVGIIGKNGAGKSTLLKLLSKVTGPTVGTIRARGRIGALLEVGTGFHPEMTGRENIYMNGAIMGMSKAEISRKLDEIIDFSGCERYIDTPVKRYSSGMTVRLGFAVAAHLDPEILVVDEVLAVGDAEFQKKAIGKMQDVSKGEGKTVLFVSHNMSSIAQLCKHCILLDKGRIINIGDTQDIINEYVSHTHLSNINTISQIVITKGFTISHFHIEQFGIESDCITQGSPFSIQFIAENELDIDCNLVFNLEVSTDQAIHVTCFGNEFQDNDVIVPKHTKVCVRMHFNEVLFKCGTYFITSFFKIIDKSRSITKDSYLELAKRFVVNQPSPIYFSDSNRIWKSFPRLPQHGSISMEVNRFTVESVTD